MGINIEYNIILLIFSIISFVINIIFYILKKKKYFLLKIKIFLIILFCLLISLIVVNLPIFIVIDSEIIMHSFISNPTPIVLFNISIALFCISLILFLISFLTSNEPLIQLDIPTRLEARKGSIKIGKIMKGNKTKHPYYLSVHDLERHMFVCGTTGSGKSNFIQYFLMNFKAKHKIPIMIVEFKGDYHFLQNKLDDLLIIRPGENLSINIFNPEGSDPEVHAERIFEILKSGAMLDANAEYTPQMQKILIDIITIACSNKKYQNWEGFYEQCEKYKKKQKNKIPWLEQSIISIQNRIRRFSIGPIKAIFSAKNELNIKELFDRDILIDLSSIIRLGGEKEDALFFLNIILKYLWDKNLIKGSRDYEGIRHMTIIEDAQYFAPKGLSDQTKISTYIEDIALLLRGTGECLISLATRPNVSEEILANCGVLVTFKNHIQKEFLCELLNLDREQEEYLSMIKQEYCIIRVNSIEKPFLLKVPFTKRYSLTSEEIDTNNEKIFLKIDKHRVNTISKVKRKSKANKDRVKIVINKLLHYLKKKEKNWKKRRDESNLNEIALERKNKRKNELFESKLNGNRKDYKNQEIIKEMNSTNDFKKRVIIGEKKPVVVKDFKSFQFFNKKKNHDAEELVQGNVNLEEIFIMFIKIQNLKKTNNFKNIIFECQKLIEIILKKIAPQIGFNYKNINQFLNNLVNFNLENRFILKNELFEYKLFLNNKKKSFTPEMADDLFSLTKIIIQKLESYRYKNKIPFFSNGYDELMKISTHTINNFQNSVLSNCHSKKSLTSKLENNRYKELKNFINKLYNLQNRNN